jgi:hypothetical protein
VGTIAAGAAIPLLAGQIVEQVVDGVVDGPAGDDGVVPSGGHDVKDVGLLEFVPPALAVAVGGVRGHP